jgi:hypothetical protein
MTTLLSSSGRVWFSPALLDPKVSSANGSANETQSRPGHPGLLDAMLRLGPKAGKAVFVAAVQQFCSQPARKSAGFRHFPGSQAALSRASI